MTAINLYNSLTRKKEPFIPIEKDKVKFYVCGVTVYDYCHIGHARAYVAFDTIRRYLSHAGYDVDYVQNFTDIDDKIIKRAAESNTSCDTLTDTFIQAYFEDMAQLNIQKANRYPKATTSIGPIIKMIKGLIEKGVAYETQGDVCFEVEKFEDYGNLSGKVIEDLIAGSRVEVSTTKKNPLDFVLWKAAKEGEPFWNSPWGKGRPGWHIECSAMVLQELGETIDIHGGGQDLLFPHHENEICQSQCYTGKPFVNYWMHNGFVNIKNEKMSKSLNNFFTIRDVLKEYSGEVLRFFLMKMHYRSPLNFSEEGLKEAEQALSRLHTTLRNNQSDLDPKVASQPEFEALEARFHVAMSDDFNYAEAIGILFELATLVNTSQSGASVLKRCGDILGLFFSEDIYQVSLNDSQKKLIDERTQAKKEKNFQRADEIRAILEQEHGLLIEDTRDGVRWVVKAS